MKINNNLLVTGLLVTLLVTIGGTWISLNYINSLTGAATTGVGSTNVTVTSVLSCVVDDNLISFGEMSRGAVADGNVNFSDLMAISNDGNVNITVVANATQALWGSDPPASANWRIKCEASQDGNSSCNGYANVAAAGSNNTLITGLSPNDEFDNFSINFDITVPADEPSGPKNGTVQFVCVQTA